MKNFLNSLLFKVLFVSLGGIALFFLLKDYGGEQLLNDLKSIHSWIFLLLLTFVPTLCAYAAAWWLVTDSQFSLRQLPLFFRLTVISIAWNNLTPFLKVAGEPLKGLMLAKQLQIKDRERVAWESTIVYNYVHLLGTVMAIFVAAVAVLYLISFPLTSTMKLLVMVVALVTLVMIALGLALPYSRFLKKLPLNFFCRHPYRVTIAILLEVMARFVEGLTFYLAFLILKNPLPFLDASLLEVGRTLIDNIFFFVPYQVGSREQGIFFFLTEILGRDSKGYLGAAMIYRLVEVIWVGIGYLLFAIQEFYLRRRPRAFA
ncbi:MAG: flippase-like domain-containing protein [Oligoflexia bacterium]|nr:flippase-like domain-containing protein [Oligoflexia bacterium]